MSKLRQGDGGGSGELDDAVAKEKPKELGKADVKHIQILQSGKRKLVGRRSAAGLLALTAVNEPGKAVEIIETLADTLLSERGNAVQRRLAADALGEIMLLVPPVKDSRRSLAKMALEQASKSTDESVKVYSQGVIDSVSEKLKENPRFWGETAGHGKPIDEEAGY